MRMVWLFLAVIFILTPIATQAESQKDAGDPVQAVLDRVAKMGLPEQQAWLKQLEERALRAAELTLSPDQATIEQKRIRSKLHQKTVSWQVLREVIENTSTRERDAIDRLAQPAEPVVTSEAKSPEEPQAAERAKPQAAEPETVVETKSPEEPQAAEEPAEEAAEPQAVAESKSAEESQAAEEPAEPVVTSEAKTLEEPQAADEPVELETVVESESAEKPQTDTAAKPSATEEPSTAQVPSPPPEREQRDVEPRPPTDFPSTPPLMARRSTPPATREAPAADVKSPPLPQPQSALANTEKALPPKIVEQAPQKVAVLDLPTETQVEPPSLLESPSETADNPDELALDDELPPDSVEIRVDELAARIRGCNMGFRGLEMELDEQGPWTAARLDPLVERLELLAIRRSDLSLFREAVPEAKRDSLDALPALKGVVSQVATRIVEARKLASGSRFKGTDSERKAELKRLEELSRRLAGLTEPQ